MNSADPVDERTFRVNFSGDGAAKLREKVTEKLKEFMGDYTDETLVEYVIVLLKNGRSKGEARNELNVFLGDDSDSFVSWLWDHLGSNLHLYVQPPESHPDNAAKPKPTTGGQAVQNDSCHLDSDSEREKSNKLSRSRHNREWKSLVRDADEPPPFHSSVIDNVHTDDRTHHKVGRTKRYPSPQKAAQKKRSRLDEQQMKRGVVSQVSVAAPRRLLQFAVRDAVATSRPSSSTSEPALKRLRSVVSTSAGDSSIEVRPRRIRSVARVPNAMATAIKAVEEAAKDVVKNRPSGNVFDRLGHVVDVSQTSNKLAEFRDAASEDVEYEDINKVSKETRSSYLRRRDFAGEYAGDMTMLETDTGMASDSASDNEGFNDVNVVRHRVKDVSQIGTSSGGNEAQDSMMVQYSVAKNSDEVTRKPQKDQEQLAANTSHKIVNISVNVNTWKPPHYQESREVTAMDSQKSVQESEAGLGKSGVMYMKENSNPFTVGNGIAKPAADTTKESQKTLPATPGLYSTGRPTEDVDSRTIFVSNVHFAATKDSLSRHFNKFGEVLKVIIVTDAATGQPKGSAYIEFMRKEAAESALSLDGTSFMSRIVKVVRKSSAHQEAAPIMTWPRVVRGSPFAPPRFSRVPFARGIPNVYRARPPIKPGARSLQWKRDAQANPSESATTSANSSVPSPTARSLTYVRLEQPKTNGSSGTA